MVTARAVLREYFGTEYFGKMLGIIMDFIYRGIVGPTSAGWVFDHFGSYRLIWLVLFGLSLLATWLTLKMKPMPKKTGRVLRRSLKKSENRSRSRQVAFQGFRIAA